MAYAYQSLVFDPADKTDFETNKASALQAQDVIFAETTFLVQKSYTDFKALIVSPLAWSDVKYIQYANYYELYVTSESPL